MAMLNAPSKRAFEELDDASFTAKRSKVRGPYHLRLS